MRLSVRVYCLIAVLTIVLLVAMVIGCSKSEVLNAPTRIVEEEYTPRTRVDTTSKEDTTRAPISFTVDVEGWGPENIVKIN